MNRHNFANNKITKPLIFAIKNQTKLEGAWDKETAKR